MSVKSATEAGKVGNEDDKPNIEPKTHDDAQVPVRERDNGYDSDTPPTLEEWKTMKGYGSFISKLHCLDFRQKTEDYYLQMRSAR